MFRKPNDQTIQSQKIHKFMKRLCCVQLSRTSFECIISYMSYLILNFMSRVYWMLLSYCTGKLYNVYWMLLSYCTGKLYNVYWMLLSYCTGKLYNVYGMLLSYCTGKLYNVYWMLLSYCTDKLYNVYWMSFRTVFTLWQRA